MELYTLHPTTFQPTSLIEGYESLIWTERYIKEGEFELHSPQIDLHHGLMPIDSMIAIRESREVMIVESHSIEPQDDGSSEILIKGRSAVTFMDKRTSLFGSLPPKNAGDPDGEGNPQRRTTTSPAVVALELLKAQFQNIGPAADFFYEIVPNLTVQNSSTLTFASQDYEVARGQLYEELVKLLDSGGLGLRAIRPTPSSTNLVFDIYNGVNRSADQTAVTPIVFRVDAGHLSDPTYLFSIEDFRNTAVVSGQYAVQTVTSPGVASSISGFQRKVLYVDATDVEKLTGDFGASILRTRGLQELTKHNQKNFFNAKITSEVPSIFGKDYNLGDWITLVGEYNMGTKVLINEYIRSKDDKGERAYPTFSPSG